MKLLILSALLFTLSGCGGRVKDLHSTLDCMIMGQGCPSDEIKELEQRLDNTDNRVTNAMDILGMDRMEITEVVNLCGNNAEILIRIEDVIISYFEQGRSRFLSILEPGNYITSDGQSCNFTVTSDYEVTF